MSAVSWQQTALCMLGGAGLAGFMMWTWHMAVMARAYVSDRFSAWKAYDKERTDHSVTLAKLNRAEAVCSQFGYGHDAQSHAPYALHEWLDQKFAAHRAELRKLRLCAIDSANLDGDGNPLPGVRPPERLSGPALRAHLALQDKDKPS